MAESGWLLGGELSASTWALRHGGGGGDLGMEMEKKPAEDLVITLKRVTTVSGLPA